MHRKRLKVPAGAIDGIRIGCGDVSFDTLRRIWRPCVEPARERCMSTSSPVRTRRARRPSHPSQPGGNRPRGESVAIAVRSILLGVAAISVIGTSNYFAYMIGRKQAAYEELRRQVDRVVDLVDQKEGELAPVTLKQPDRLEHEASAPADLTTSTINGRTTAVAPKPAPDAPPGREANAPPPEPAAAAGHRAPHPRASRRQKLQGQAMAAEEPAQPATGAWAAPDAGVAGQ
jgi:hypothetical protein